MSTRLILPVATAFLVCFGAAADEVEMRNGDRYIGKVKAVDATAVTLQSDVLGVVKLPRGKVASIALNSSGKVAQTNAPPAASPTTSSPADGPGLPDLSELKTNAEGAQASADLVKNMNPEARQKFNDLLRGMVTGKLSMADLRKEARAVADQTRALRSELGPDGGAALDQYLEVLDKFLQDSAGEKGTEQPARAPSTNAPPSRVAR